MIERAARGDAEAKRGVPRSRSSSTRTSTKRRGRCSSSTAEELKARLLDLLPRWYEHVFAPTAQEWREAAERDAESKRALAARHSPEQLVELATRGYQYTPAPDPDDRLLPELVDAALGGPLGAQGHEDLLLPDRPRRGGHLAAEVARVYKALGDEGRLKLLRRLTDGPLKLSEAAVELGVAKSTAHHHLAILRQAGFVAVRDADDKVYTLRRDLLPQAGELLNGYLGSSRSSSTSA